MGNPAFIRLNDINVAVINEDILKEMCNSIIYKECPAGKIEQGLRMMLE